MQNQTEKRLKPDWKETDFSYKAALTNDTPFTQYYYYLVINQFYCTMLYTNAKYNMAFFHQLLLS